MRHSTSLVTPILACLALRLLSGPDQAQAQTQSNTSAAPVSMFLSDLEQQSADTARGGFGETFAVIGVSSVVAVLIIRNGGAGA